MIEHIMEDSSLTDGSKVYLVRRILNTTGLNKENPVLIKGKSIGYEYSNASRYNNLLRKYLQGDNLKEFWLD